MNLPDPKDITAYIDTLFGADYTRELRALAKPAVVDAEDAEFFDVEPQS